MNQKELNKVLEDHEKWLNCEPDGKKAALRWANLTGAALTGANLTGAVLRE